MTDYNKRLDAQADALADGLNKSNDDFVAKLNLKVAAGAEAARGAWGIAQSLVGSDASNAQVNQMKNQLLTLNPELAKGVAIGQEYYLPNSDTQENFSLAMSADRAYAAQNSLPAVRANGQGGVSASYLAQLSEDDHQEFLYFMNRGKAPPITIPYGAFPRDSLGNTGGYIAPIPGQSSSGSCTWGSTQARAPGVPRKPYCGSSGTAISEPGLATS